MKLLCLEAGCTIRWSRRLGVPGVTVRHNFSEALRTFSRGEQLESDPLPVDDGDSLFYLPRAVALWLNEVHVYEESRGQPGQQEKQI